MKTLDSQKLDVTNETRSNIFGWRNKLSTTISLFANGAGNLFTCDLHAGNVGQAVFANSVLTMRMLLAVAGSGRRTICPCSSRV
jgi:hypothetical protein